MKLAQVYTNRMYTNVYQPSLFGKWPRLHYETFDRANVIRSAIMGLGQNAFSACTELFQ